MEVERSVLARKVAAAAEDDNWCSDGVFSKIKDSFYPRATDIICE